MYIIILQVFVLFINIVGYVLVFRRSDFDFNYSSVILIGVNVLSYVIVLFCLSQCYDIKILVFISMEFGDFFDLIIWCLLGKLLCQRIILYE